MKIFKSPLGIIAFFMLFLFLGIISFFRLPVSILPDIEYPMIIIETVYQGAGASEVEKKVTEVLEKSCNALPGLDYVRSISQDEKSSIYLVFKQENDFNSEHIYTKVREKIETVWNMLPDEADIPVIKFYDPQSFPSIIVSFSKDQDISQERVEILARKIESIDGIAQALIKGFPEKSYNVTFDIQKISDIGISFRQIFQTVKDNNFDFPGGLAYTGGNQASINIRGSFRSISDISGLPIFINRESGSTIRFSDIATIKEVNEEKQISFSGSRRLSSIEIFSAGSSNMMEVSGKVRDTLDDSRTGYEIVWDISQYIRQSSLELYMAVFISFIITFSVIFLFFRDLRLSGIVSTVIPFAVGINFLIMYVMDNSLNIMSLSALAISVGIIVDNSLVVGEKLLYYKRLGVRDYISKALSSTVAPVTASVLTTIIAFVPVVWLSGLPGKFYSQQAVAISSTLLISLFLAFFLVPSLFKVFSREYDTVQKRRKSKKHIHRIILRLSLWFTKHRYISFSIILISMISGLYLISGIRTEFLPDYVEEQIYIRIDCDRYNEDTITFEAASFGNFLSDFTQSEDYLVSVDYSTKKITVMRKSVRNENKYDIFDKIKEYLLIKGLNYEIVKNPAWNIPEPFRMELRMDIFSENMENLYEIQQNIEKNIIIPKSFRKISSADNVIIKPDIAKLKMLGLDIEDIKFSLEAVLGRKTMTELMFDNIYSLEISDLSEFVEIGDIPVISSEGNKVRLKEVCLITEKKDISPVLRKEGKRCISINFPVIDDIDKVMRYAQKQVEENSKDIEIDFSGVNDLKDNMLESMGYALIIALILIYLILVIQYESFLLPLSVMLFVPVSYSGAFLLWIIYDITANMMSILGIVILTGITVNNSIILLSEYIRKKSVVKAVSGRISALIITSATTAAGAFPMIFGVSSELRLPVALTLIGGITASFLFNLLLFPSVMRIFRRSENV